MTKLFDIEQSIQECWSVTGDLRLLAKEVNDGSDYTEFVRGLALLYDMKFQKLWDEYEQLVRNKNANIDE